MSAEKVIIFGLCAVLANLQHGVALPPGLPDLGSSPTPSPSPSPSPLAIPAPSPSSSPNGTIAAPFANTLFTLPQDKSRLSTAVRVSNNEDVIEDVETRLSTLESSFENMTIIQNDTNVDIATLRTDVDLLQSQMSSVTSSITNLQNTAAAPSPATDNSADIDGLSAGLDGVIQDLASTRASLEFSIADVGAEVTSFHNSLSSMGLRVTENENAFTGVYAEIDGLSSRVENAITHDTIDEIDDDLDKLDKRINALELQGGGTSNQADIDSIVTRVGVLENTQNTLNSSAIDALQEQVTGLESTVGGVSASLEHMEGSITDQLRAQDTKLDDTSAALVDLMSQLAETRAEIGVCQKEGGCDDIHTMIDRMQTQAAEIEALVNSLSATSTENAAFVGEYRVKVDGMETTIASLQSQLDAEAAGQTGGSSSLQGTVDGLVADVASLQEAGTSTTSSVTALQSDISNHATSIETLQAGVTGLQSSLDTLMADILAVESESSALKNSVNSQVQNLQAQIDDLSDTVDSMIEDIDTSCDYPWSYRSSVGTCIYTAYSVKAFWIDASDWCEAFGKNYRLYKVDTKAKQSDLVSYINYYIWDFSNDFLIGFSALSSQQYKWTDGSSTFDSSAWCYGEPNNWGHGCGSVWNGAGLCLDDVNCDAFNKFICEKVIS
ncbi:C-type lectin domain family 4 member F-like [Haliotis asinina]|uniref:C-type lectin domain family 4 member F-like n=1 Tax=Haliotis asinina TaxID=109174 RepID=UPI0035321FA9